MSAGDLPPKCPASGAYVTKRLLLRDKTLPGQYQGDNQEQQELSEGPPPIAPAEGVQDEDPGEGEKLDEVMEPASPADS